MLLKKIFYDIITLEDKKGKRLNGVYYEREDYFNLSPYYRRSQY